ncbi:MAG: single-stranded-DNA-specific exonuclease RecJ [Candidatus Omnitrophota bacterium]|nr:MAG: single-stranded-DNA-specific exonuclease RecJ [Candidatus Omnitrophota bacterium]
MEKIWNIRRSNSRLRKEISRALRVSEILAQILINRGVSGVKEAESFLSCSLTGLHSPFLLKGMKKAVARIKKAISSDEKIMVWGDYDIDGVTSVALLISVLGEMGARALHYLPNRLEEGYGLNEKGAKEAKAKGVGLLITVDCGISADKEITYLKSSGIDTIVCDHHQPKEGSLPKAAWAIINPLQKDCSYPYKYMAGVGLAAKLACALMDNQKAVLDNHLDIIALGTVGDVVPLTGENRVFVKHGLSSLSQTRKLGLVALMEVSGLDNRTLNARHIGFILGPRINASGRLGSPEDSLRLLLARTELEARTLAQKLNQGNRLRQRIESRTLQEAIEQVESQINFKEHSIIVLGAPHWHRGVIGIVASRLVERYMRPTIMMSLEDEFGRGSGRSIGNFHLLEALRKCKDLLEEYGGHRRACGLKLKKTRFSDFFRTINRVTKEMLLPEDLVPALEIDAEILLSSLSENLINELNSLSPFGADNPEPLICSSGLKVKSKVSIVAGNHIKFWVTDGKLTCEAIGYNKKGNFPELEAGETVSLAYAPSVNNWQGNFSIQLKLEDVKISR